MELLIPLIIFLLLCIVMIVALAHVEQPQAFEVVEAYIDSYRRNDKKTQKELCTIGNIPEEITSTLNKLAESHDEYAADYKCQVVKIYDDNAASYQNVQLKLKTSTLIFVCRKLVNQWSIVEIIKKT